MGKSAWNTLQRASYVWIKDRWVAYPFQNNIAALDKGDQVNLQPAAPFCCSCSYRLMSCTLLTGTLVH